MVFFRGVLLIIFGLLFCLPLALRLLPSRDRSILQIFLTSFGVSIGFLTLLVAYLATFYKPLFNIYGIVFSVSVFSLVLFIAARKNLETLKTSENLNSSSLEYLLSGSLLFICVLLFWDSIYYPFVTQDAITHYAMPAKNIFLAGGMDGFYVPQFKGILDAYPLLVPLSYVFNYFAWGQINEHAAKVIPGLFGIGLIGSTYLLGKHLYNKTIGLFAALLLSFTHLFLGFATSGYTDIPGAFFYTNSILYYWLTYRYQSMKYAILTGLMVGFSVWTKNSTLLIFISVLLFFIILFYCSDTFRSADQEGGYIHLSHLAVILGISSAIGGPWYLRNYLLYGYLVPLAHTRYMHLGVPLFKYFGAIGWHVSIVYVFGLFYGFYRLVRKDTKILFLLSFVLPYLMVWVLRFRYDPRFLLAILPLFAVLGIWAVGEGFQRILGSLSRRELATLILCGILVVPHIGYIIVKNRDLFLHPSMSDDEKRLKTMKRFYPLVLYLKDIRSKKERDVRIIDPDTRLLYFLGPQMVSSEYPMKMDQLKDYDYFVCPLAFRIYDLAPKGNEISANLSNEKYFVKVFESGGNIIYKIVH